MTEGQVREKIKKYFEITELVGNRTYKKHGERAWRFLDYRLLRSLLIIREGLGRPITVNSGKRQQRGLRTIVQQMIKNYFYKDKLYISAHLLGKAVDFDVEGMTAEEVRAWILKNKKKFPFKIRLERNKNGKPLTWNHLDVIWEEKNSKVHLFDV
ncbi:MAG: hypothetical protein GY928_02325 [Colwellia sp.]|nr:hypothetical protein [Colwellia sp.]